MEQQLTSTQLSPAVRRALVQRAIADLVNAGDYDRRQARLFLAGDSEPEPGQAEVAHDEW